jgi:hypothetical protein
MWNRGARRSLRLLAGARRWTEVIQLAETGLGYSPGYEPFHTHLLLAGLKCGNRPMAIRAFTRYESILLNDENRNCSQRIGRL